MDYFRITVDVDIVQMLDIQCLTCEIVPGPDLLVFMVPRVFMVSAKFFLSCPTQRHDSCLNLHGQLSVSILALRVTQPVQGLHHLLHNACWESAEMA